MLKRISNIQIKQSYIIFALGAFELFLCFVGELLSLDKIASLPYFIMGIVCSVVLMWKAKEIIVFSPLYNFFITFFFAITFSAFYYFDKPMVKYPFYGPTLLSGSVINEVNIMYLLFGLSMLIPIIISLFINFKLPNIKMPKIQTKNINLIIVFYIVVCALSLTALFIMSGISPLEAITNPLGFRGSLQGTMLLPKLILSVVLNVLLIICYFDIFLKKNNIKPWCRFMLFGFLFLYTVISGSRSILISAFINMVIIYFYTRKIKIKHLWVGLIMLSLLLVFSSIYLKYRNMANDLANGNIAGAARIKNQNFDVFKDFAERQDSFVNTINFFAYIERGNDHESILLHNPNHLEEVVYHFCSYVPRKYKEMLFGAGKGGLFALEMTETVYNVSPESEHIGFDMGGISNLYWVFGILGVIFGGVIYGVIAVLLQKMFDKYSKHEYFVLLYLLVFYFPMDMFFKTGLINSDKGVNVLFNLIFLMIILFPFCKNIKIKLN